MNYKFTKAYGLSRVAAFILTGFVEVSAAQQTYGELKGQVTDASGAVVPGVGLTLVGSRRSATASTDGTGAYVFAGLTPGRYQLRARATGFATYENGVVDIAAGRTTTLPIRLVVALEKQEVTVTGAAPGPSTAADANASAIVLRGEKLDALPDDPDELAGALKILAGPAAGPSGGEIYIDGLPHRTFFPFFPVQNHGFCKRRNDRVNCSRSVCNLRCTFSLFSGAPFFGVLNRIATSVQIPAMPALPAHTTGSISSSRPARVSGRVERKSYTSVQLKAGNKCR